MAPRQSQRVRLFGGIQACADSGLFAPASNQSGARCAQTHNGGWARTNSGWYTKLSGCCFGKRPLGSVCWLLVRRCSDADACDISAAGVCDCAVRTLAERESRPRPHVVLCRCKTSAICLLLLLLCVRECSRERERKKLLSKLNLYAAIQHS